MRTTKPKREIPHEKLERDGDGKSGRYMKIGTPLELENGKGHLMLADKIIFPINECPHCGSKATFHRVIQESGDEGGNVLRESVSRGEKGGHAFVKYDYCLDCFREFIIEIYVWKFEK